METGVNGGEKRGALPHGEATGVRGGVEAGMGVRARGGRRRPARACAVEETDAGVVKVRWWWRDDAAVAQRPGGRRGHKGGSSKTAREMTRVFERRTRIPVLSYSPWISNYHIQNSIQTVN